MPRWSIVDVPGASAAIQISVATSKVNAPAHGSAGRPSYPIPSPAMPPAYPKTGGPGIGVACSQAFRSGS